MAIRPWGIPPFDAIIIRGEWNDERWRNHHQGRIAIRPYDAAEGIRKGELLFAPIDQASNARKWEG